MRYVGILVRGAAAGFAGTLALQVMQTASTKAFPTSMPLIRKDPGELVVETVKEALPAAVSSRIPALAEAGVAKGLAAGYGITAGAVYGLLRPSGGDILVDGVALGMATWAAGYLGWLPALGLLAPIREQNMPEAIGPVVRHALFGIAVVAAYGAMASRSQMRGDAARIGRRPR